MSPLTGAVLGRLRTANRPMMSVLITCAAILSVASCAGPPVASLSQSTSSASASPTATPTAPATTSCDTENTTEEYPPTVFVCTESDAGELVWMEESASKKLTDARAAAAALAAKAAADKAAQEKAAAEKAAQEKAAADKAAQEAAAKAAADKAAADKAAQEEAARAEQEKAAAAEAARQAAVPVPAPAPAAPSGCDPNYAGACVPIASDVDCSGGSGNGPAYVGGPVSVVGSDIYGLDRNGDGVGCE